MSALPLSLQHGYETAPLLVWLQGGPGSTSLYGLFTELGPFFVGLDNKSLDKNPYSWHKNHSIIFIDNPVGTGKPITNTHFLTKRTVCHITSRALGNVSVSLMHRDGAARS
jgi:hypothetical protein